VSDAIHELSVVITALNEEANIEAAVRHIASAMKDFHIDGEIVLVNDGSTDQTAACMDRAVALYPEIPFQRITHVQPRGIGAAFWEGLGMAHSRFFILLPGDDENDPWEIFRYAKLLEHVDIVIPFIFNREARPLWRNALSFVYRFIINSTFAVNFNYTNGTVLYRTSVLRELDYRSTGFFFQTDILVRSVKKGYLFAEVPYRLGQRKTGRSKAVSFVSFYRVARGYLRLVRDYYFLKSDKMHAHSYASDSVTARRRKGTESRSSEGNL
jgi:glycosyltransferase involved in cell wall biosynthesis